MKNKDGTYQKTQPAKPYIATPSVNLGRAITTALQEHPHWIVQFSKENDQTKICIIFDGKQKYAERVISELEIFATRSDIALTQFYILKSEVEKAASK